MANERSKIDSIDAFTGKGLRELEVWMERFFKASVKGGTGGGIPGVAWEDVGTFASGVTIPAGGSFTFFDHNGVAIFKINEDGSLQGKTGKSLTFNL